MHEAGRASEPEAGRAGIRNDMHETGRASEPEAGRAEIGNVASWEGVRAQMNGWTGKVISKIKPSTEAG